MISREFACAQVSRLSGTTYYQQRTPEAISDLIEVLREMAESEEECSAAVSLRLSVESECPTVADMRAAFVELREGKPKRGPATQAVVCPRCHSTGYVIVCRAGWNGSMVEVAEHCGCR